MSDVTTDPALVAADSATDLDQQQHLQQPEPQRKRKRERDPSTQSKERHSLTLSQRRELRHWANSQTVRPSHKACIDWFQHKYGMQISQSTVSHSLSPKYARLDGANPQLSGSRLRFGNWPDVEKLVLLWYQQLQAEGRQPTNDELGERAKSIFTQLARYKDQIPPEFSPGWIHRFKKRYSLLVRGQRQAPISNGVVHPADDIEYLADCVPRILPIAADTSPTLIRDQVLQVVGVESDLGICALVRDEIVRRMQGPHQSPLPQHTLPALLQPPSPPPPPSPPSAEPPPSLPIQPPPETQESLYTDDDTERMLQNALHHLQQETHASEERERAEQAEYRPEEMETVGPADRVSPVSTFATPGHDMGQDLSLDPIHSNVPMSSDERPIRCPYCVNQRMLRTIREAVEHMSSHVIV